MIRSVRLDRLPEDLVFPSDLAAKISFARDSHELRFEGFMSKTDFDKLVRLHNDLAYQRALEQLFQKCTFRPIAEPDPKPSSHKLLYGSAGLAAAVCATALAWNFYPSAKTVEATQPPTSVVQTANSTVSIATTKPPAAGVKTVNHLVHGSVETSESFDGEIKP